MEDTKRCSKCGEVKPIGEFSKHSISPDGIRAHCRSCVKIYFKSWYTVNGRDVKLRSLYGITPGGYEAMLESQNLRCKICNKHIDDEIGNLCVDHDHVTGKVRGLLCHNCNTALGKFRDSPEIILNAYEYLLHNGESVDAVLGALEGEAAGLPSQEPIDVQLGPFPDEEQPTTETGAAE